MPGQAFVAGGAATIAQSRARFMRRTIFDGLYPDGAINPPSRLPELGYTMPDKEANIMVTCAEKEVRGAADRLEAAMASVQGLDQQYGPQGHPSVAVANGHLSLCERRLRTALRNADEADAERESLRRNLDYLINVFSWAMDDTLRAREEYSAARAAYAARLAGLITGWDQFPGLDSRELSVEVSRVKNLGFECQAAWALYTSAFEAHQKAAGRLGLINPVHGLLRDDDDIPGMLDPDFEFALHVLRLAKARCGALDADCQESAFSHFRTGTGRHAADHTASALDYDEVASRDLAIAEGEWARESQRLVDYYLHLAAQGLLLPARVFTPPGGS